MKIFDKGNTGTKYKCDIGLLASMETLPLSHSVLDTHHNQTLITYHSFSPCCLFPTARSPSPAPLCSALQETLGWPGLGNSSLIPPQPAHTKFHPISSGPAFTGCPV